MATKKLHELLAVRDSVRKQSEATRTELKNTFGNKKNHFTEQLVTFKAKKEGLSDKEESRLNLQTTVSKELDWIGEKIQSAIDVSYQIDVGNLTAKADVVLDNGVALLRAVPATTLLELEKRVHEVMELVKAIPTLDPSRGFELDDARGKGIFKARDVEKPKTEKVFKPVVMVAATDKHPAQVEKLFEDVVIGHTVTQEWCSLITVAAKGDMLDRIEELSRAVKSARSRANDLEIDPKEHKIGERLLAYAFEGTS